MRARLWNWGQRGQRERRGPPSCPSSCTIDGRPEPRPFPAVNTSFLGSSGTRTGEHFGDRPGQADMSPGIVDAAAPQTIGRLAHRLPQLSICEGSRTINPGAPMGF